MRRCESVRSRLVWKTDGLLIVLTNFNEPTVWEHYRLKTDLLDTRYDFPMAVNMKLTGFWEVTPCNMVGRYQYSGVVNSFEVVLLTSTNKFHVFLVLLRKLYCEPSKANRLLVVLSRLDTRQVTPLFVFMYPRTCHRSLIGEG
jgi:hypothetical protein